MMQSADIRQQFLDFFHSKGHTIVPSAPIVVKNDPTLLFTNAGMNQFKDYFLGNKQPKYIRVADTQKCLRVSGKHNDLEEVGVDTYHHTMFEMLGNWSFGDYFKKEAIAWSWQLLTEIYQLDKERLYITIFEGDEKEKLEKDEEALLEWKKYLPETHIINGNKKDNFWEMGDTGPCGPSSEIHYDSRSEEERRSVDGKTLVNADHPQVIEIWNNVFMEFNRRKDGSLEPLPAKHVDTGMGFERLVRVIQGKHSNYDTDIFTGTISATETITGKKYDFSDSKEAVAFRVLADHIRAIAFTIADGQLPASTGAGYVIRRILRRAVRYYYSSLGYKQPLLYQLLPLIAIKFKSVFPDLSAQLDFVKRVVREEEEAFLRTLEKGLKRMDDLPLKYWQSKATLIFGEENDPEIPMAEHTQQSRKMHYAEQQIQHKTPIELDGKMAFELYDTFGFPIDLTKLIVKEKGWSIDEKGFEAEMQLQKDRSRAATTIDTEDWISLSSSDKTTFVGYNDLLIETEVVKYRKVKSRGKEQYQLVLAATPFYAESGGQVGDTGSLTFGTESVQVTDTKKENNLIVHFTNTLPTFINGPVTASVNFEQRLNTTYNHTATHLMHAALRQVLGHHVSQKGSLVTGELLRFDFAHFSKMTDEELRQVEIIVNEKIRQNIPVITKELPKEEALKLGAMALFGEKYGDTVRVVIADKEYSVELCGGTHVGHTGMIGVFSITSETAVASGVRRIEAVTGAVAMRSFMERLGQFKNINELLKTKDPLKSIEKLLDDKNALEKRVESLEARHLVQVRNELLQKDEIINGVTFVGDVVEVSNPEALKKLCYDLKNKLHDYVAVVCANIGGKPFVAIGISDTVVAARQLDAAKMIRDHVAPMIKGGGGGQKSLATAGGTDSSNLKEVIDTIRKLL